LTWRIENARVPGESRLVEVSVLGTTESSEEEVFDAKGKLVLPSFAELHTHLDKTYSPIPHHEGGLLGAINAHASVRGEQTVAQVIERAETALRKASRYGVTALRSHVNSRSDRDLEVLDGLLELRKKYERMVDLQFVAMGSLEAGQQKWLEAAISKGADLVGGAPSLEEDPAASVYAALDLAKALGVGLDLHIDEHAAPEAIALHALAVRALEIGFLGSICASHCSSLACLPVGEFQTLARLLASAKIKVIGLPICNLVLLQSGNRPRSAVTAPLFELEEFGILIAVGSDNVSDPFNPYGDYSPLLNLQLSNLLHSNLQVTSITSSLSFITSNAKEIFYGMQRDDYALGDWVVVDSEEVYAAVARPAEPIATFKGGNLVYQREVDEYWLEEV